MGTVQISNQPEFKVKNINVLTILRQITEYLEYFNSGIIENSLYIFFFLLSIEVSL